MKLSLVEAHQNFDNCEFKLSNDFIMAFLCIKSDSLNSYFKKHTQMTTIILWIFSPPQGTINSYNNITFIVLVIKWLEMSSLIKIIFLLQLNIYLKLINTLKYMNIIITERLMWEIHDQYYLLFLSDLTTFTMDEVIKKKRENKNE